MNQTTAREYASKLAAFYGLPVRPALLGLSLAMCWCYASQRLAVGDAHGTFQIAQYLAMGVTMLLGAAVSWRARRNFAHARPVVAAGVAASVALAPLIVLPGPWAASETVSLAVALADGAVVGWHFLMWAPLYARLSTRQAYACVCGNVALAALLKALTDLLSHDVLGVVALASTSVLTTLCFFRAVRDVPETPHQEPCFRKGTFVSLRRPALGFFCLVLGCALFMGLGEGVFGLPLPYRLGAQALSVVVAACALVFGYRTPEGVSLFGFWFAAVVVIATGLVGGIVAGAPFGVLSMAVFTTAQAMAIGLVQLAASDVAARCELPAEVVLGVGWGACFALPMAGGLWLLRATGAGGLGSPTLAIVVLWLLLVALVLMRPTQSPELRLLGGLSPRVARADVATAGSRLEALARERGLTPREAEVIGLYAQGRNRAFISAELVISEYTVRDHVKSAYKKLGVHNKQELIDLLRGPAA